jgi:hypothetical protein
VLVHTSGVTAVTYSPVAKMVAMGDRAGAVSLLDLAQPALLWLQARAPPGRHGCRRRGRGPAIAASGDARFRTRMRSGAARGAGRGLAP